MMMKRLALSVAALVTTALVLVLASPAGADPGGGASVFNKPDGGGCVYVSSTGNVYDGTVVFVVTPSGNETLTWSDLALIAGPGVTKTTRITFTQGEFTCKAIETKNGKANVVCHN